MNKKEKTKLSVEETVNITNGIIENTANTWGEKHPAYELNKKLNETKVVNGGTVEIGYAGDWDFDDFTRELTRIETNYLGKTGEMDYNTFLVVLSHIRNVYEKYHKSEGLNNFEKKAIIDANNKMTESGLPVCEVSGIAVDRESSPKGEITYLDKGYCADKPNNLTSLSVENRDKLLGELKEMLNRYGIDTICNTPDFILADALLDTIYSIEKLQKNTNWWFGRKHGEIIMDGKTEDVKSDSNHLFINNVKHISDEDLVVEYALEAIYDKLNQYNSAFSNGLNREEVINKIKERLN